MSHTLQNLLPKEKHMSDMKGIGDVSEYLKRVSMYIEKRRQVLNSNCFFEKNLFDTMRQNKLTREITWFQKNRKGAVFSWQIMHALCGRRA